MSAMEGAPNHPKTFGEELQKLRQSAGLSLDDIAAETKISKQILSSLESGDFRYLPQKVFCRNFVNQYAVVVGTDPYTLLESFDGAWDRFLLASGAHPRLLDEEAPFIRTVRWRFWIPVLIAAAIVVAAAVVIWRSSAPNQRMGVGTTAIETPISIPPSPSNLTAPRPSPGVVDEPGLVDQEDLVSIIVRVEQEMECWVHFRDRDGVAGGKLLAAGTEETLEMMGPVKLTIGDASAVVLEVGGEIYRNLGRPGQVVHTEVSYDGLRVLGSRALDE